MRGPQEERKHDNWPYLGMIGATGGLIGAGVMTLLQLALRPYLRRRWTAGWLPDSGIGFQAVFQMPEPASLTARRFFSAAFGEAISPSIVSALVVHGSFGALGGVFYVCLRRRMLPAGRSLALGFGAVLWLGATEVALPLLSLSRTPACSSPAIQLFGLAEHLAYGLTVEQVCQVFSER